MTDLIGVTHQFADSVNRLSFGAPVTHVYNPLVYAQSSHDEYLARFGGGKKRVLFWGMNPGPWGMAQTGIPFGEVAAVRDWMGISCSISEPPHLHPKRPIQGFDCPRSEVSGRRLWGLMERRFGNAETFFSTHLVMNYCPLVFMEESGRNRTPDKLPVSERRSLFSQCDLYLEQVMDIVCPDWVVGIGAFASSRIQTVLKEMSLRVRTATILHPSPASPRANRNWDGEVTARLIELGIWDS